MGQDIPKKIHYCWFGGNELPDLAIKCISSWKKYLPDYEIIEWNESNFDIGQCDYIKMAYEAKKWAFVSDYARFKVLYQEGGIYFDTDVEVIKSIDDIVALGNFMACEAELKDKDTEQKINPGLGLGVAPGLGLIKEILDDYENSQFDDNKGNPQTVVERTTQVLKNYGFDSLSITIQNIKDISIYPSEYFCPYNYWSGELNITTNTRTIHHYYESWHSGIEKFNIKVRRKLRKYRIDDKVIGKIIIYPLLLIEKIKVYGFKYTIIIMKDKICNLIKD